ncbi:MAG: CoA pyrophosphatase [Saprospiraceae bacterium]|jgi:8-oxo-dGTP pyrophosphatase MutT (NUDIX family)|nr:CoA pyrophosphatase [Saprospiraceae bacterium]MBP6446386.1 CoA pyrophosphatase [Saprospiraceae bacterium]
MDVNFIHRLEKRLYNDLPGEQYQNMMAPVGSEKYRVVAPDHKVACVLALLFPKDDEWHICFIERSSQHPEDKHAGQISFPGGKFDENDYSFEDCALRETYEEIGVPPDNIGILGGLTPLYVYVSNFLVHPFVGFTSEYPDFKPQISEVSNIIELPLSHLMKEKNKGKTDIEIRNITLPDTPYYNVCDKKMWGATAMIVSELEQIISSITLAD